MRSKKRNRTIIWATVAVVALVGIAAAVYIAIASTNVSCGSLCASISQPVSSSILADLDGVTSSTLSSVGTPSSLITPSTISGTALTLNGKPEIVYIGGEYCPYCAFERWGMIIALDKFGNFTGLEYMLSSSTDVNANTPTFTFENATYTSSYVSFYPTEEFGRGGESDIINQLTTAQQDLVTAYDSGGSIPFVDFANSYTIVGASSSIDISGYNWTQVASELNDPSNTVTQQIDGTANYIIAAICKIDGSQPSSVCSQETDVTLSYLTPGSQISQTNLNIAAAVMVESRWIG